jgi:ribosome-associated heat shock protein Hsp15
MMGQKEQDTRPAAVKIEATQRLDKWLWYARLVKSRTLAAQLVTDGKVRVNRTRAMKPSQSVRIGDVLTIASRGRVCVWKVLAPGERRGPPAEARTLYEDLSPQPQARPDGPIQAQREPGSGRPTKRERRHLDRLTGED